MNIRDLPVKVIVALSLKLLENKGFKYLNPFNDFENNEIELDTQSKWTGNDVDSQDVEFMAAFIKLNEDLLKQVSNSEAKINDILPQIEIPTKSKYKIDYSVYGPASITESYDVIWSSYDEDWADDSLKYSYWNGDFYYYNGNYLEMETDNFEPDNFVIEGIKEINESEKSNRNKIILENTGRVIDTLDRKTLLKLKNIIDSKLKSL